MINEFLQSAAGFVLSVVVAAIAGAYFEHKLKALSTLKKLWYFFINSESSLKMVFVFTGNVSIAKIKNNFYKIVKENKWRVLKEEKFRVIYTNDEANLDFFVDPDGKLTLETSKVPKPIRDLEAYFDSQCQLIDKFSEAADCKLESAWFEVHLPYYQEFAKFSIPPRYLELKDYHLTLRDRSTGSDVKVVLGTISASHKAISSLKSIFHHIIAIY